MSIRANVLAGAFLAVSMHNCLCKLWRWHWRNDMSQVGWFIILTEEFNSVVMPMWNACLIRDSRYFGLCLRSKNATGWLYGEREPTSIG